MQLRRIEIRDFRKLSHTVVDDLGDGLSVLVGDNEAGKSTVLAALRAVLFERHRGTSEAVKRMLPYGQTVRPEVLVDFDLKGDRWRLRKAFNQRPEAELAGPGGQRWTGDAVEDCLADLFSSAAPGRGESKPEQHQGLYGLLWVEQGRSHRSLGVGGGRETLASALESEVGQVLGGERGRALLAAAQERKDRFWGKNEKARGEYREIAKGLEVLSKRRTELQTRLRTFDEKVEQLARRSEILARHAREDSVGLARDALKTATDAAVRADTLAKRRDEAAGIAARCATDRDVALERRSRRSALIDKAEAAEVDVAGFERETLDRRGLLARHQATAEAAEVRLAAVRLARVEGEGRVRSIEAALSWRRRESALKKAEAQLKDAEAFAKARWDALGEATAVVLTTRDVEQLEHLQKRLDGAQARRDAASVQIAFEPDHPAAVAIDGVPHASGSPLLLVRDAVLALQGFGRIKVRPGGGTAELVGLAEDAAAKLAARLRSSGSESVTQARADLARKTECERHGAELQRLIVAIAPGGFDALRADVENERAALARPLSDAVRDCLDLDEVAREGAHKAGGLSLRAEAEAEADAAGTRAAREGAAQEVVRAETEASGARRRRDGAQAELAAARAQADDAALVDRLNRAEQAFVEASHTAGIAVAALESADPEGARLDLERAQRAERAISKDIEALTAEKREFEIELRVLGSHGLSEDLADIEGQILRLERELAAQDLQASASRLLVETLTEAQRESKERWLGPVRERVKPYLRFIEPDSDILLNEQTLEIEGLVRRGVREPFHALSMGAREQVAVITRLALADILQLSGRPSALILDDALVNTDQIRLERMHRVLQTAAKSLQVLVLTCRERDFWGLGDVRRM